MLNRVLSCRGREKKRQNSSKRHELLNSNYPGPVQTEAGGLQNMHKREDTSSVICLFCCKVFCYNSWTFNKPRALQRSSRHKRVATIIDHQIWIRFISPDVPLCPRGNTWCSLLPPSRLEVCAAVFELLLHRVVSNKARYTNWELRFKIFRFGIHLSGVFWPDIRQILWIYFTLLLCPTGFLFFREATLDAHHCPLASWGVCTTVL